MSPHVRGVVPRYSLDPGPRALSSSRTPRLPLQPVADPRARRAVQPAHSCPLWSLYHPVDRYATELGHRLIPRRPALPQRPPYRGNDFPTFRSTWRKNNREVSFDSRLILVRISFPSLLFPSAVRRRCRPVSPSTPAQPPATPAVLEPWRPCDHHPGARDPRPSMRLRIAITLAFPAFASYPFTLASSTQQETRPWTISSSAYAQPWRTATPS